MFANLSDAEIVQRAQAGNSHAAGELYDRYYAKIFRYIRAKVSDTPLAQDLTGEVFLRMVAHLQTYRNTGVPFSAWLYRIAHNYLITAGQKEQQFGVVDLSQAEMRSRPQDNPVAIVEQKMELERVLLALKQIEALPREVIILRFWAGLSLQEVADVLEKSVPAIKSAQHRGLITLQGVLKRF